MPDVFPPAQVVSENVVSSFMSGEIVDDVLGMPHNEERYNGPKQSRNQGQQADDGCIKVQHSKQKQKNRKTETHKIVK